MSLPQFTAELSLGTHLIKPANARTVNYGLTSGKSVISSSGTPWDCFMYGRRCVGTQNLCVAFCEMGGLSEGYCCRKCCDPF
jgi:hypothetical protein